MKEEILEALNQHFFSDNIRFKSGGDMYPIVAYIENKRMGNINLVIDGYLKKEIEKVIHDIGYYTESYKKVYICGNEVIDNSVISPVRVGPDGIDGIF